MNTTKLTKHILLSGIRKNEEETRLYNLNRQKVFQAENSLERVIQNAVAPESGFIYLDEVWNENWDENWDKRLRI